MPWSWVNTEYSIYLAQHTPSTAYTEYNIHRVQYTLSTACTQDCLSSLHFKNYKLTAECSCTFQFASLQDRPPPASSQWQRNGKVTWSHSHGCELTNWWIESHQYPVLLSIHHFKVFQSRSMIASKYISKLARLWPQSSSLRSHDYGLQVHLQTWSSTASKCISKRTRLRPPSLHADGVEVHLHTRSITASKCISKSTQSTSPGAPQISVKHHLQPVQTYYV